MPPELMHLLQQIERQQVQRRLLSAIARRTYQLHSLDSILQATLPDVREALAVERLFVCKVTSKMSSQIVAESVALGWNRLLVQAPDLSEILTYEKLQSHQQAIADIYFAGLPDCDLNRLAQLEVKAYLVVPILTTSRTATDASMALVQPEKITHSKEHETSQILWGWLIAHQCSAPRQWDETDLDLMDDVSVQLAIAIQQASYQKIQTAATGQLDEDTNFLAANPTKVAKVDALEQLNQQLEAKVEQRTTALQASEEQFRQLAENIDAVFWMCDREDHLLYVSPNYEKIWQRSLDSLYQNSTAWFEAIHSADQARIAQVIAKQHVGYEEEYRILQPTGDIRWVRDRAFPIYNEQGEIYRVAGIAEDITQRKQVEEELSQTRNFLQTIIDNLPVAVFVKDGRPENFGNFRLWNRTCEQIFGLTAIQAIGNTDYDFFCQEQADFFRQKDLHTFTSGIPEDIPEEPIDSHSLGRRILHTVKVPIYNEVREPEYLLCISEDITERKQAEKALRESEEKFRQLAENIDIVFWIRADDNHLLYVSPSYTQVWGGRIEDLYQNSQSWRDAIHPEDQQQVAQFSDFGQDREYRIVNTQGELRWIRDRAFPIYNERGEIYRIAGIAEDITERKHAELEILRNRDLWQAIFNESADALFLVDAETVLTVDCNWRAVELFEVETKEALIQIEGHVLQCRQFTPDELQAIAQEINLQGCWSSEIEYVTRKGNLFWGNLAVKRITVAGRNMNLVRVSDISDRKRVELMQRQQLERERLVASITQRIRESLDLSTILKTTVSEIHKLLQSDRALVYRIFADGTGQAVAESITPGWSSIVEVIFPSEAFPVECHQRYIEGNVYLLSDRDHGSVLPCLVEFMQTFDIRAKLVAPIIHQGTLWGLLIVHQCSGPRQWQPWEVQFLKQLANQLAIATQQSQLYQQLQSELHEREQAQAQLESANQQLLIAYGELARANRHKDEFLANMSHELRTPLNAVLGMAEGLLEEVCGPLNEEQKQAISIIEKSGTHLLDLINDILDLAKIEAGSLDLNLSTVSVAGVCESSLTFVQQMALKKKIQLTTHIQPGVSTLQADERRLQQVLINLLSNALKFTPEGGIVRLEVGLESRFDPSGGQQLVTGSRAEADWALPELVFSVIDTGIGIAENALAKIFQPFVQLDSALNRQYTGTGLGLALVHRLVEMHKGTIQVESKIGEGSCFSVRLPQTQLQLVENDPFSPSPIPLADAQPVLHGDRTREVILGMPLILLVEDNSDNIETFAEYLQHGGCKVLVAHNGSEAVEIAKEHHPHLIVMDIQMPQIDGLEATRRIRADLELNSIPIIALTASAAQSDREKSLAAGANAYLTKPVSLKQLLQTIHQFLAS